MSEEKILNEIKIIRVYDAPLETVWDAWTDPKQVAQWWGPRGFTLTTHSKDLKTGGHWNYTMHGPDGVDYPNATHYLEVEPYARLVYDHGANDTQAALFRVTVSFTELKGKTKMDMSMRLPTPDAARETKAFIKKAGGHATWDRLAEFLEKISSDQDIFVINRTFEAPMAVMFDMWTNPKHLSQWVSPKGFTMRFIKSDIKEGSETVSEMSNGEKMTMHGKAMYLEITPHRIVYTQQFCDAKGNTTRHPMAPTWPETMLTTVVLSEEGPNLTRVTLTWKIHGSFNSTELETFIHAKGGMTHGWTGSFDKLEDYLAQT